MKLEMVVGITSLFVFFVSFYVYASSRNLKIGSAGSMSDYFSGIFFLRGRCSGLMLGRFSLVFGIPSIEIYKYFKGSSNAEYLPLIVSIWAVTLYFWLFSRSKKEVSLDSICFFSEFLMSRGKGIQGFFLWSVRVAYLLSIAYVFWARA